MTKLEEIARAIQTRALQVPILSDGDYRDMARAAVEAMRDPSENMKYRGRPFLNEGGMAYAAATWDAMIDAILTEKPASPSEPAGS